MQTPPKPTLEPHIKEAWAAYTTTDETGRNGRLLGYFTTQRGANKAALNQGWYGGNGNVQKVFMLLHDGHLFLLASTTPVDVDDTEEQRTKTIKSIVAKLTKPEIDALGLDPEITGQ